MSTHSQPGVSDQMVEWDTSARRIFSKLHGRSVDATLREASAVEFDGNCPMLGSTIEAWAIANVSSKNEHDAIMAKLIIDGYFFGRYQSFTPEGDAGRERGFNLSSRAYYAVRVLRTRLPGQSFEEARPHGILIFRDYDLSPKTFSFTPKQDATN